MATHRHLQDRAHGVHAVVIVAGAALLALVLSACAQPLSGSGPASQPPRLHLVTGSNAQSRDAAPAGAGFAGFGGYVLVGSLPDEPTYAAVRRWPDGPAGAADIRRLARTLGVTGTPARHAQGWVVTGAAGELRIRDGGGHQWSYTRADRAGCPPIMIDVDRSDGATSAGCAMSVGPGQPPGPTAPATRSAAAPLLAALGFSPSDAAAATVYVGTPDSTLSVSPAVEGMPTQGIETSVYVDNTGIASASGRLSLPTAEDVYPLRTAKQAFEELANGPRPLIEPYCGPIPDQTAATRGAPVPPVPCPGPAPIRVTGARIGLLLSYDMPGDAQGPGTPVMVPAWFFTVADGGPPPAVIAIDPAYLAPPGRPQPTHPIHVPGGVPGSDPGGPPETVPASPKP